MDRVTCFMVHKKLCEVWLNVYRHSNVPGKSRQAGELMVILVDNANGSCC